MTLQRIHQGIRREFQESGNPDDIEPDLNVWKEYASAKGLHPSILSYLSLKREHFYHIDNTADRICFVTARGWEDLSAILYGYEDMHFAPDENLIRQYLQDEEIARDFGAYYQLYAKYRQDYRIPEILSGSLVESVVESLCTLAAHAPTDERLTVAGLLLDGWNTLFLKFREEDQFAVALQSVLRQARASLLEGNTLAAFTEQYRTSQNFRSITKSRLSKRKAKMQRQRSAVYSILSDLDIFLQSVTQDRDYFFRSRNTFLLSAGETLLKNIFVSIKS